MFQTQRSNIHLVKLWLVWTNTSPGFHQRASFEGQTKTTGLCDIDSCFNNTSTIQVVFFFSPVLKQASQSIHLVEEESSTLKVVK